MWYLYLIVGLAVIGPAIYYLVAHLIFRLLAGWRRYRGASIREVAFIMVFSFPVWVGDSNFGLIVPLVPVVVVTLLYSAPLSELELVTFSGPDLGWGIAFYGLWLFMILAITAVRVYRRRAKWRAAADAQNPPLRA